MKSPNKVKRQGDTLSLLFHRISQKAKLNVRKIKENNLHYVNNPANQVSENSSKRSSAAGNIRKELERQTMTWRVFEKLIRWMRPKAAKVFIVIDWRDGTQTVDQINLRMEEYVDADDSSLEERQVCDLSNDEMKRVLIERGEPYVHIPGVNDDLIKRLYPEDDE